MPVYCAGVENHVEHKRLLLHSFKLEREQENDSGVACILRHLSAANRLLGLYRKGMQQSREAVKIYERLGDTAEQANCWDDLARLLHSDNQLDAAEKARSRAISPLPEKGQEVLVCQSHRGLGGIYLSKGEKEKAVHHFGVAVGIASHFNWHNGWINECLAQLSLDEQRFDDANAYIKQAKIHTAGNKYNLGRMMGTQAMIWYRQGRLEDATSEALGTFEIYDKLGASEDAGRCKNLLQIFGQPMAGEFLK